MTKKHTPLDKRRLPLQKRREHMHNYWALVPLHPAVFDLPVSSLEDGEIAKDALLVAKETFEQEVCGYIEVLEESRCIIDPSVYDYNHFDPAWRFSFQPHHAVMAMRWENDGTEPYSIALSQPLWVYSISLKNGGRDAGPEEYEASPGVSFGNIPENIPGVVFLPPQTASEYSHRVIGAGRPVRRENATVYPMRVFQSSPVRNVPQALLLRDWAVEYNNRLLEMAGYK